MKKILMSLVTIAAMSVLAIGATTAVFSDTATIDANTFATGKLDLRVNEENSIKDFDFPNAAPGKENGKSGKFTLNNYGKPFDGESTLEIKEMVISARPTIGQMEIQLSPQDSEATEMLYNKLWVEIRTSRPHITDLSPGWTVYEGPLKNLKEKDLLGRWRILPVGMSQDVSYIVWLPKDTGNEWQGKSAAFDFVIDAYNPHR